MSGNWLYGCQCLIAVTEKFPIVPLRITHFPAAVTIGRIYIDKADTGHFKLLFDGLQKHITQLTGKPLALQRFHPDGNIKTMIVDMEAAQVLGAGLSLMSSNNVSFSEIKPESVEDFLSYWVRICLTHAKRYVGVPSISFFMFD
jgi:hypothetical protein